jgi:hypothetical protein
MARQSDDLKNTRKENSDAGPVPQPTLGGEVTTVTSDRISQAGIQMASMCSPVRQVKSD